MKRLAFYSKLFLSRIKDSPAKRYELLLKENPEISKRVPLQGMFIRSRNIKNPVLLYIHGGPAFPNYFLIDKYAPRLEDNFTVCTGNRGEVDSPTARRLPWKV